MAQNLIPKEFLNALVLLTEDYVKLRNANALPAYMPAAQEVLKAYRDLNTPNPAQQSLR